MSDFEEIYQDYFKDVFLFMRALCRDENLSEEITQETFVKALASIEFCIYDIPFHSSVYLVKMAYPSR